MLGEAPDVEFVDREDARDFFEVVSYVLEFDAEGDAL